MNFSASVPENDLSAERFARHMQDIVAATLLVHEVRRANRIEPAWLLDEADKWLTSNTAAAAKMGLGARRAILADI